MTTPFNDLDRAIVALHRSAAATPQFYRALSAGELCALMPYHPEVEGATIELKNGMKNPFVVLKDDHGEAVLIFSSVERAEEGMKRGGVAEHTYLPGEMPAKQLLGIIGHMGLRAVVNKSCTTGEIIIPPNLMRDLADGIVLRPPGDDLERERFSARIVPAADYPTNLIQPIYEALRQHANFRAAWIVDRTAEPPQGPAPAKRDYGVMLLMQPRDPMLAHEVTLIAQAAGVQSGHEVHVGLLDEADPRYIASLFRQTQPFYTATDYQPPKPARRARRPKPKSQTD